MRIQYNAVSTLIFLIKLQLQTHWQSIYQIPCEIINDNLIWFVAVLQIATYDSNIAINDILINSFR